ncbi:hypothetical protein ABID82_002413 [Methylobacterium sp. PvP062]|uniref:Uncharacterized protein n=1 Tax=Methylobacterium radiotolerans TaxID=31998 RepID=A0ABV2NNJ9_9HYPH|nr:MULTISPECIES: hypothetical protein [unclassified Methylobacterium]MBP2495255.1 hypothetical protein [Methylobacterium sp. PvP105]MBP2504874.1 hypothetical protein [Methylobacterium sp. PvP109]MCX7335880.1 hypothetical protein [Hyphomicrobiales bacterium]
MADPTITVQGVVRETNPNTRQSGWRATLRITEDAGPQYEFSAWYNDTTEDLAAIVAQAKADLHRISSQLAAGAAQTPDPSTPSDLGESERERKWREGQERAGSGWAV